MAVDVRPVGLDELKARLYHFEAKYGLPSEQFIDAFRNGRLKETEDFREWSMAYGSWRLVTGSAPRTR
jgi:hypothetical protein